MSERQRIQFGGRARGAATMLAGLALALGCSANVGAPPTTMMPPSGSDGGQTPPDSLPTPAMFKPAPAGLRRLTQVQYRNSIADLLGDSVTVPVDIEQDTALSGFASIGAALVSLSPHLIEQFETSALSVAKQAMADTGRRAALVGCNPTAATDDACLQTFLKKFGRKAWRRPLTTEEITTYQGIVKGIQTATNSFFGGLEYGIAGLLQSPHFLYREEWGSPDPTMAGRLIFNDHELATRLSFFLWNSTPDDALLDAADAQQLTRGNGFATQVERLLKSPRAASGLKNFFSEYYRLAELDTLPQLPSVFPQKTDTLGAAMREETARFLTDLAVIRNADFREMFDSPTTFVNAELAKLYGLPPVAGTDFAKTTLPESGMRVGYLGQGSFLALNAHSNIGSATYRGKFIREMMMCQSIPPPPMSVPALPDDSASPTKQTMRQKLQIHREVEPCKTCHALMDPLGLAFENFDGIGAFRTMDAGQTIDASGDLDGVKFSGPRELAKAMKDNPLVIECVARNLYRYVTGHVETQDEEAALTQLTQGFKDGKYQFSALVNSMVRSAGFVLAAPPSEVLPGGGSGGAGGAGGGSGGAGGADGGTPDVSRPDSSPIDQGMVPTGPLSYATHIAPILTKRCEPCHTTQARAGVNFSFDTLVTNSATSAASAKCDFLVAPPRRVVAGDPDHSLLWVKLSIDNVSTNAHFCGDHMPPAGSGKVVPTVELDTIQRWIQQGARP